MVDHEGLTGARIQSLRRYPVKSMQGETCQELNCTAHGVAGDRAYGVQDIESGTILSAKREGRLLEAAAFFTDGVLGVRLPDGDEFREGSLLDDALSNWLGRPLRLVPAATYGVATFQATDNFEDDESPLHSWEGQSGSFVDESPLHLITTGDLARLAQERPELHWDVRRFRPNVVIESDASIEATPGHRLSIGEVEVEVLVPCYRCVMTTRPQPGNLERELDILRHVSRAHHGAVGVRAWTPRTGSIRVGDVVADVDH
jgi:uncharacterized protein YcbX